MNTRCIRPLIVLLATMLVSACASKPQVLPSTGPHAPTSPDQIKFYEKAPKKYEKLGQVTVSREEGATWDERGDATTGFDILKRKAAALGANGLLMTEDVGDHRITAGYHGTYYQVPIEGPQGQ